MKGCLAQKTIRQNNVIPVVILLIGLCLFCALFASPATAAAPVAGFSADVTNGPAPVSASFSDTSTNTPASWLWEYREASSSTWTQFSTTQSPTAISFSTPGTYDIRLTAENADGSNTTIKTHIFAVAKDHDYLATVASGTVSGDVFVSSVSPFTTSTSQTFTLPALSVNNITWARLYVNSYSGKADSTYALTSIVAVDGTTLGTETLDVGAQTNGNAYPVNDHVMKVYSDYGAVYNLTGRITSASPVITVTNTAISGKSFDGRIKGITLVAAYNDGDSDGVRYIVNAGNDWMGPAGASSSTTFDAGAFPSGWTNAAIKEVAFSGTDASYTFPAGSSVTPTSLGTSSYWKWDSFNVTDTLASGSSNTFGFTAVGASFKPTLAVLTARYPGTPAAVAPVASFTSTTASGTAPLTIAFADTSTNTPTGWLWDFGDSDSTNATVQNPVHTYSNAGTYTVNLTTTNAAGSSYSRQAGYVTVSSAPVSGPDLIITGMTFNTGGSYNFLFANETNTVSVTVKNNGTAEAGASVLSVDLSGASYTAAVGSLGAGSNQTVTVTDSTIRMGNSAVTITATADSAGSVAESSEANNIKTSSQTVYNHGYKGKRYTGGNDLTTTSYITGRNTLLFSSGNSAYASSSWKTSTTSWTSSDLPVPSGSEIVLARLYQPYSFDQTPGGLPNWTASYNGNTMTPDAVYRDRKGFGTYDYPYGLYVYNVTNTFSTAGNTLLLTAGSNNNNSLYGGYVVVVYRNATDTQKAIWINEEADLLIGKSAYAVSSEEATAYAPFGSVDTTGVTGAKITAIATGAGKGGTGSSKFLFNGQEFSSFVPGYLSSPQISLMTTDVTTTLRSGSNNASFQSTGSSADTIIACTAILVVESSHAVSPPVASFTSTAVNGTAPLTVVFTDTSINSPTGWLWDFGDSDSTNATVQNPVHTYSNAGTYTVNLTATNAAGSSYSRQAGYVTVSSAPVSGPDLIITGMTFNTGGSYNFLFANETNTVSVTVKNNGTAEAGASVLSVDLSGASYTAAVGSLGAGSNQTVTVTDNTIRMGNSAVAIIATADSTGIVTETNETNNILSSLQTVYHNGYKSKRYTGGSNITTTSYITGRNTLLFSSGNSAYASSSWKTSTTSWTSSDLPVPSGSEIVLARLYQPYSYDQTPGGSPNWTASFNGNTMAPDAVYRDRKSFGTYDYPYGLYVYNVTNAFSTAGNTLLLTAGSNNNNSLYGGYVVVVYRNATDTQKAIWINEEADLLIGKSAYAVSSEEATAYAPFAPVDTTGMIGSKAIAIATGAGKGGTGSSKFLFNGQEFSSFVPGYMSSPQISILSTNVNDAVQSGSNTALFQSTGSSADTIIACTAILVVESSPAVTAPVASFGSSSATGSAPLTVVFTDTSTNSPTGWLWDFGDSDSTNATVQNPVHTYATAGTYSVNLTATNVAGSGSITKNGYVTVASSVVAPAVSFTTNPAYGLAPLSVQFNDTSSNTPTSWTWEYRTSGSGDGWTQFSTTQNATYSFIAGAYDIRFNATNSAGSNVTTKYQFISSSGGPARLATVRNGTVSGDLYVGAYQPVAWSSQSSTAGPKTFTQAYSIPAHTNIDWARLYAVVYAAGTDNRAGQVVVSFDGNGDGTYETELGNETLATYGSATADVYPVNGHANRQYSDYKLAYNVTSFIGASTVSARIATTNVNSSAFDGRLKELTLVVAYNDGDTDQVKYWVNEGHDYQTSSGNAVTSTFATSPLIYGFTNATLTNVGLSTTDAAYTFNGNAVTGTSGTSLPSFEVNAWNVTGSITPGSDSSFIYTHASGKSYKTTLATLAVKYPGLTSPAASFTSSSASGTAPFTVIFTDTSSNLPTGWLWNFGDSDNTNATVQNPVHTYAKAGTYSVNLTATNAAGSGSTTKSGYIAVTAPHGDYDLTIAGGINLTKSTSELPLFARESNLVRILSITNIGTETSPATDVELRSSDGYVNRTSVPSLTKGSSATVTIPDTTIRLTAGSKVTYTAAIDPDNVLGETIRTNNNATSIPYTVTYNGYKGKTYWEGKSNLTTRRFYDLNGGLLYSSGDSQYVSGTSGRTDGQAPQGSTWTSYSVQWTPANLPIPQGAVIREARLYVPYTWDNANQAPGKIHIDFNGERVPYAAWYSDKSNFGSSYSSFEYGLMVYNVTDKFAKSSQNTAVFTRDTAGSSISPYGFTLAVVYDDPTATRKQIFVNEEFDLLGVDPVNYGTTPEEATAYVPFSGGTIVPADVMNATLVTFVPSGNGPEGNLIFNGNTLATNVWEYDPQLATQVAIDARDVTAYLVPTGNEAAIRETGTNYAVMGAAQQFLIVDYKASSQGGPISSFSSNVTTGYKPLAVRFTDLSTGSPNAWFWEFGDGTNATGQNPVHVYSSEGTYTVSLNSTSATGTNTLTRSAFITVKKPSASASFVANKTSGDAPMTVQFTDTSAGEPDSWSWNFGDGSASTVQSPVHTYTTAGTYTAILKASNTAGNSSASLSVTINARTVEEKTFAITNLTATGSAGSQNVTVSTTNTSVSGNTVTLIHPGNGWQSMGITMTDAPANDGANITGTVASVVAQASPVTVPIADVGTPAINYTLNLQEVPNSSAQITMTITKDPDSAAQSSFTLAASGAGKQIDAIAYSVNFNKTRIANQGDGGMILNATICMAVSPAWVTAHGGRDHIVIMRRADDGTTQVLSTQFQGIDSDGNEMYQALSPNGLSTFILSSVSTPSSGSGSSGGSGSSSGSGGSSGGSSLITSSSKQSQVYEYRAPHVTTTAWIQKTLVADKGRLESLPITAEIASMPDITAKWTATIPQKPDGGGKITTNLVRSLPDQTLSLYRGALASNGFDIGAVAYSLVINEENIPQTMDAVIEMSVPQDWVRENGGIGQVRILRIDDEAVTQVLETSFVRYDKDSSYIVFQAKSPDGLCTFSLVSVKSASSAVLQIPAGESSHQPVAAGNLDLADIPVRIKNTFPWVPAGMVLAVIVCLAGIVLFRQRIRKGP